MLGLRLFGLSLAGLSLLRLAPFSLSLLSLRLAGLRLFGLSLLRLALVGLRLLSLRLVGLGLVGLRLRPVPGWPPSGCVFPVWSVAGLTCLASLRLPLRWLGCTLAAVFEPGVPEPAGAADCSTRTLSPWRAACCGSAVTAAACAGATVPAGT